MKLLASALMYLFIYFIKFSVQPFITNLDSFTNRSQKLLLSFLINSSKSYQNSQWMKVLAWNWDPKAISIISENSWIKLTSSQLAVVTKNVTDVPCTKEFILKLSISSVQSPMSSANSFKNCEKFTLKTAYISLAFSSLEYLQVSLTNGFTLGPF